VHFPAALRVSAGNQIAISIISSCSLLVEAQSAHLNHTVVTKEIRPIIQLETPKAPDPEDGPTSPYFVHQYTAKAKLANV